jgi:hypothetical protein
VGVWVECQRKAEGFAVFICFIAKDSLQAVLLGESDRLVVVETDAGNGYMSLFATDPMGPAEDVATARAFFRNELIPGGYRGFVKAVIVEDDVGAYAAARANAALAGPKRYHACAVSSDWFTTARGGASLHTLPHSACGLNELLAARGADSGLPLPGVAMLVLNKPTPGALLVLQSLLRDGTLAGVAADLTSAAPGGMADWAPFVDALTSAGFTTHALVRPAAERLRDPEPPEGSMLGVPKSNGTGSTATVLPSAWSRATAFVSARKPLLHYDEQCKGKV